MTGARVEGAVFALCSSQLGLVQSLRHAHAAQAAVHAPPTEKALQEEPASRAGHHAREEGGARISSEKKAVVLSIVYSEPSMLVWQVESFRKHLRENITEYIVVIDASSASIRAEFVDVCARLQIEAVLSPFQAQAQEFQASWLHGQALDWAWEHVIMPRFQTQLVLITEQDVFLTAPLSLSVTLRPVPFDGVGKHACFMSGVLQERANADGHKVQYLHPSAIVIDLENVPFPESLSFSPLHYNGSELDTGGALAPYFQTVRQVYQEMDFRPFGGGEQGFGLCFLQHRYADETSCFWESREVFGA